MKITGYCSKEKEKEKEEVSPPISEQEHTAPADVFFSKLEASLPPVFSRELAAKHLGGILTAKTLNNIDYRGEGPETRVRIGKKVGYEKETFVRWLRQYRVNENT